MASIVARRRKDGTVSFTAQIRLKKNGTLIHQETETFERRVLAVEWAARRKAVLQEPGALTQLAGRLTFGELVTRCVEHLEAIEPLGRTKRATLLALASMPIADTPLRALSTPVFMEHARLRRLAGAAPPTLNNDFIYIRTALKLGRALWAMDVNTQPLDNAVVQLRGLGWIGKSRGRSRRPTPAEWAALRAYFAKRDARSTIKMLDLIDFAVASCRRQEEITALQWADVRESDHTVVCRDMKHPRQRTGNDRRWKALREAWDILQRQPRVSERIFPVNARSVCAAFTRACRLLGIVDLHFHDLRHHGISLLFERGYSIQEVQLVSLHESWQTLRRYTHLQPGDLRERD